MKLFIVAAALTLALVSANTQFLDAPTGFDNKANGIVDDGTHQADQMKFDEVEQLSDGLGPRSRNYALAIRDRTDGSALPTSRSLTEPRSSPAALL